MEAEVNSHFRRHGDVDDMHIHIRMSLCGEVTLVPQVSIPEALQLHLEICKSLGRKGKGVSGHQIRIQE